jgi:serine/threonine protein phosphatase PrpC
MESILFSGHTDPGKRRKENQDTYTCRPLWSADKALLAVVDGVGGYAGGEKAARIARESIEQYMQIPRGDTLTMLREAVTFANNRIVEARKENHQFGEMCCVLTTVVADVTAGTACFVHVGDTRLYRYRNGQLQKLTKDHSFVGLKEDAGEISELEAMNHPHRNQILREVGSATHRLDDEDFMDYGVEPFLPGDLLLLCSDGLTDMITSQQITTLLSTGQSLTAKVNNLVALANEMGGYDNITVVLLQNNLAVQPAGTPVTPVAEPVVEQHKGIPAPVQKTFTWPQRPGKHLLLWAVLLILLVAAAGWYFSPVKDQLMPLPAHSTSGRVKDTTAADSVRETGVRTIRPAAPRPLAEAMTDTLRLSSTKNFEEVKHYADSVKKMVLLMPAKKSNNRFAAIEITRRSAAPGDTLILRNLRFVHFETAIKVTVPIVLKPENIWFDNVKTPVTYTGKPDSTHRPVLFMNSIKQ